MSLQNDIYKITKIVNSWPLHLFDTSVSMDIPRASSDLAENLEMALDEFNNNGFYVEHSLQALRRLKACVTTFMEFGISLKGSEDLLDVLSKYEPELTLSLRRINKELNDAINSHDNKEFDD